MTDNDAEVELHSSEYLYSGFLKLSGHSFTYRTLSGGQSKLLKREVCERKPAVAVLPYHPESDSIMMLEQFRLPAWLAGMQGWQFEVVAGLIEQDQSEEETALRESREEAGLEILELWHINRVLSSPGGCDEVISTYLGRLSEPGVDGHYGLEEEDEDIRAFMIPFDDAYALLEQGRIENATAWMALAWLKLNHDEVLRCWKT
ncbi:NUDIX domain-containing protein [Fodinicurvata sediminis]|uniref:NUDIX domain-containing protein n=1 Tax=Fodinicurvata sediminis TaxID=1121832 RepID=UPI0003B729A5|nr:NUDIX domain-containing protein [Fodinicurvata sediminis]